jgi:hypothetical protein
MMMMSPGRAGTALEDARLDGFPERPGALSGTLVAAFLPVTFFAVLVLAVTFFAVLVLAVTFFAVLVLAVTFFAVLVLAVALLAVVFLDLVLLAVALFAGTVRLPTANVLLSLLLGQNLEAEGGLPDAKIDVSRRHPVPDEFGRSGPTHLRHQRDSVEVVRAGMCQDGLGIRCSPIRLAARTP